MSRTRNGTMLNWAIRELLGSLPERRDWFNPDAEKVLRAAIAERNKETESLTYSPDAESLIPHGWEFYTSDFTLRAAGKQQHGWVTLVRDAAGRAEYHALPDGSEAEKAYGLYAQGKGATLREAIAAAAAATGSAA